MHGVRAIAPSFLSIDAPGAAGWDPELVRLVLRALRCLAPQRILDIGSGLERFACVIKEVCPRTGAGVLVDRDPLAMARLRALAASGGLFPQTDIVRADLRSMPFGDGRFDLVACQTALVQAADPVVAVREAMRVCRRGGAILIAEPVAVLERACFAEAAQVLRPDEMAALVKAFAAYHRGVRLIHGHDPDVALRMPAILGAVGVDPGAVSMWRNPVPCRAAGRITGLLDRFTGDTLTLAQAAGLSLEDWERARRAAVTLEAASVPGLRGDDGLHLFGFVNP